MVCDSCVNCNDCADFNDCDYTPPSLGYNPLLTKRDIFREYFRKNCEFLDKNLSILPIFAISTFIFRKAVLVFTYTTTFSLPECLEEFCLFCPFFGDLGFSAGK